MVGIIRNFCPFNVLFETVLRRNNRYFLFESCTVIVKGGVFCLFVFGFFVVLLLALLRSRSSMDRIMDSGSIDWSSSLHGITVK